MTVEKKFSGTINWGTGVGVSVREIADTAISVDVQRDVLIRSLQKQVERDEPVEDDMSALPSGADAIAAGMASAVAGVAMEDEADDAVVDEPGKEKAEDA